MDAPTDPQDRERLLFMFSHHPAILAVVKGVGELGEKLEDVVIVLGDTRRQDFMWNAQRLFEGVRDLDADLRALGNVRDKALCTYLPRSYIKERLLDQGLTTASALDHAAPDGMVWVYAVTMHGRSLTMISLRAGKTMAEA